MKESSIKNFEWHRERVLREKRNVNPYTANRVSWNVREIEKKHGVKAARELVKEATSKERNKKKVYFT